MENNLVEKFKSRVALLITMRGQCIQMNVNEIIIYNREFSLFTVSVNSLDKTSSTYFILLGVKRVYLG